MKNAYNLFASQSLCASNIKIRIGDRSLSTVVEKRTIQISNSIILNYVLNVSNLSCNQIFISQLTKTFYYFVSIFHLVVSFKTYH